MKKAFTLPTCKTCVRIFEELQPENNGCEVVDIKSEGISPEDLDKMKALAGLTESDYRRLILEEYTFLKRPVFLFDNEVCVGSAKAAVQAAKAAIAE